ncbi:SDR family NAD(P)-dependent oxidoreductase [Niabella pedocola]|uniref:SDR family NAD(P)-dependent oxidoreductase n=1 Tax=Niabella pedocola TaxID=1752077 RepID=UPI00374DBCAB
MPATTGFGNHCPGGSASYRATDVSRREDLNALVNHSVEQYGRLDAMINNAGISQLSRIEDLDVDGSAVLFF